MHNLLKTFFYWKGRERYLPCPGSQPRWPELGQAKGNNSPTTAFPVWWQGTMHMGHLLLLSREHPQGAGSAQPRIPAAALVWDAGVTHCTATALGSFSIYIFHTIF